MRIARVSLLCLAPLSACAATPAPAAPEYPKVEAKPALTLNLTMASSANKLSLPCATSEPAIDNGLDDDCDGRVDQAAAASGALSIALAHASDVDVKLVVSATAPATAPAGEATAERVCDGSAPFAIQHLDVEKLEPGHYDLTLVRADACGKDKGATVSASLSLDGKAQVVYAIALKPGESVPVASLDVK